MLLDTNSALIMPIGFNSDLKGPKIIFLIFILQLWIYKTIIVKNVDLQSHPNVQSVIEQLT